MTVGKRISNPWLSADEIKTFEAALVEQETGTKGEIVPILLSRAFPWRHSFFTLALLCFAFYFSAFELLPEMGPRFFSWLRFSPQEFASSPQLLNWLTALCLAVATATVFSLWPPVQRLFLSRQEREWVVRWRTEIEFARHHFNQSSEHATIVLLVSVFERQVVVYVEPELQARIPPLELQQALAKISRALAAGFAQKQHLRGWLAALQLAGDLLRKHAPGPANYRHQFPAQMHIWNDSPSIKKLRT